MFYRAAVARRIKRGHYVDVLNTIGVKVRDEQIGSTEFDRTVLKNAMDIHIFKRNLIALLANRGG